MLDYDFENSVGYWICQASQVFQRAFNEELAPQGVTFRQAQVLGCLAFEGRLSQTDLADRMRIEPPTLVGILDRMERDGWIRRSGDASDRRRKELHLTRRGKKRLEAAIKGWAQAQARFESTFGSGRTSDLRALLHAVTATQLGPEDAVARGAEA